VKGKEETGTPRYALSVSVVYTIWMRTQNTEIIAALWVHLAQEKIALFTCTRLGCIAYAVNRSKTLILKSPVLEHVDFNFGIVC